MNATKKLVSILSACALLAATAPAFADPGRRGDRDYQRDHSYFRAHDRDDGRGYRRGWDPRRMVVVERPVRVERPVYYARPERINDIVIPAAILGAVIGGYLYSQR